MGAFREHPHFEEEKKKSVKENKEQIILGIKLCHTLSEERATRVYVSLTAWHHTHTWFLAFSVREARDWWKWVVDVALITDASQGIPQVQGKILLWVAEVFVQICQSVS